MFLIDTILSLSHNYSSVQLPAQFRDLILPPTTLPAPWRTVLLVGGVASVPVFVPFLITMSRAMNPNNLSIQTQEALG